MRLEPFFFLFVSWILNKLLFFLGVGLLCFIVKTKVNGESFLNDISFGVVINQVFLTQPEESLFDFV